ncbi:MAG: methyltransferase domain-containing protein [Magnetococcales bacterium]|nr:methyltransferase domain-containing protein [Magnetococcales bacterium]
MKNAKERVSRAFGQARSYHQQAGVQRQVARQLADRLAGFTRPMKPRILEVGCGTGFLSRYLLDRWPDSPVLLTDLSPPMVQRCQQHLGPIDPERVQFLVMDAENPCTDGPFDLIVSSLVFQWFEQPFVTVEKMVQRLAPGGRLVFTTLGPESFAEWRRLCTENQVPCGLHDYPEPDQWQSAWPDSGQGEMAHWRITEDHPSAYSFLRGLKVVGAALPSDQHQPATVPELRRLLKRFAIENRTFQITYHIMYGCFTKYGTGPTDHD